MKSHINTPNHSKSGNHFPGKAWRLITSIAILPTTFAAEAPESPYPPSLMVKENVLCRQVVMKSDYEAVKKLEPNSSISKAPIALLSTLCGTKETLDWLRKRKLLPIKHVWIYMGAMDSKGSEETIKVGTIKHLSKLESEIGEATAEFDWRTTSNKQELIPGHYQIHVVFANNKPVRLPDGSAAVIEFEYAP